MPPVLLETTIMIAAYIVITLLLIGMLYWAVMEALKGALNENSHTISFVRPDLSDCHIAASGGKGDSKSESATVRHTVMPHFGARNKRHKYD